MCVLAPVCPVQMYPGSPWLNNSEQSLGWGRTGHKVILRSLHRLAHLKQRISMRNTLAQEQFHINIETAPALIIKGAVKGTARFNQRFIFNKKASELELTLQQAVTDI